ncbi:MAG: 50S ribosomal protein L21 [bacterium]|nr:50S ribosomal protein L21 [bacterium]
MLAVIRTGGKQYAVREKDTIKVEKISGDEGKKVTFDDVLFATGEDGSNTKVGQPRVAGAKVEATVLEQGRAKKVSITKYKSKTRYHKVTGHRQPYTKIEITKISA